MALVIVVLVGTAAWAHRDQLVHIAYIAVVVIACLLVLFLSWKFVRHLLTDTGDIDGMDGLEFERYVADLLRKNSYRNVSLTERFDLGVDIIAEKDGVRWGIQVKRHSRLVKAAAVRQAVTGLPLYGCDRAMVITNSTYSTVAQRLATGNNCLLIDRAGLNRLINNRGAIL